MEYLCREAESEEERISAHSLVLKEYARSGYISEEVASSGVFGVLPSDILLQSSSGTTLVVFHDSNIIGTVSLVFDSPKGFPMDCLYHEELERLRQDGRCLAEVVQLATDQKYIDTLQGVGGNLSLLLTLFRGVLRLGEEHGVDGFCITVNPKHDLFYTELGFGSIGEEKLYEALGGAPTLPKVLFYREILSCTDQQNSLFQLLRDTV